MKLELEVPDEWAKTFTERELREIVTNALGDAWRRSNGLSDYEREGHNLLSSRSFRPGHGGMTNPRDEEELDG